MRVVVVEERRSGLSVERIRRDVRCAVRALGHRRHLPHELTVVFISPRESRALNRRFRRKRQPSNVLSFNYGSVAEVIVTPAVVRREARARGEPFTDQLRRTMIHGLIHLLGVHHENSDRHARRFERLERCALARLKL